MVGVSQFLFLKRCELDYARYEYRADIHDGYERPLTTKYREFKEGIVGRIFGAGRYIILYKLSSNSNLYKSESVNQLTSPDHIVVGISKVATASDNEKISDFQRLTMRY